MLISFIALHQIEDFHCWDEEMREEICLWIKEGHKNQN